ncbi:MAG: (2Fe-2S) ferredoxin domain-containing protein [Phycisphaeraceae bacterium]|nr:(2Fe-2S) ferredoxin domain-containing protein [Phycisphaeraceae bacterium]
MAVEKPSLFVCMGSACHQRGVYDVVPKLRELIAKHRLDASITLKGSFCLGPCTEGIVIQYGEYQATGVGAHNIEEVFFAELLPLIEADEATRRKMREDISAEEAGHGG